MLSIHNVVGAFSSNQGRDFKAVLDAIIGIAEPGAEVPMPEKGRWPYADIYMGDGWSIAYRTLDAQHWGVAQRRRRCYLVGDFRGGGAGPVLFESEGLSGYSAESFRAWQRTAGAAADRTGAAGCICLNDQGGICMDISIGVSGTLRAQMDGHPPCIVEQATPVYTITPCTFTQIVKEQIPTLTARDFKGPPAVNHGYRVRKLIPAECAKLMGFPPWWCAGLETENPTEEDISFWAKVWETHRRAVGSSARPKSRAQVIKWLQHPHSDSAEYKMWGNGVALPNVFFVLAGIVWSAQISSE